MLRLAQIKCARRAQMCPDCLGHAHAFANLHWTRFDYALRIMLPFANLFCDEVPFEIIARSIRPRYKGTAPLFKGRRALAEGAQE